VPTVGRVESMRRLLPKGKGESGKVAYKAICSLQNFRGLNLIG